MERVVIKGAKRLKQGHLWVFSNEVASPLKEYEPGSLVEVYEKGRHFLGIGYINPRSLISIRLLTRKRETIDAGFFARRMQEAKEYRRRVLPGVSSLRVVYSEADVLPGLIVDRYNDCLSIEVLTLGMERLMEEILEAIERVFRPSSLVLRLDSSLRLLEGLPLRKEVIRGGSPKEVIEEGEMFFGVDPLNGQKTGFFLDQRENRLAFRSYVDGGVGLDLFCYTGAFGLHLAKKGARVIGVEQSEWAIEVGKRNLQLNGLADNYEFVKADVFDFLRQASGQGRRFDFVIIDPPSFTRSRRTVKDALRGYKEVNRLALSLLRRGGLLCTSSCSYHVDLALFLETIRQALSDSNRQARVLEVRSQSKDHPVLISVPETGYLKCIFMEVL